MHSFVACHIQYFIFIEKRALIKKEDFFYGYLSDFREKGSHFGHKYAMVR